MQRYIKYFRKPNYWRIIFFKILTVFISLEFKIEYLDRKIKLILNYIGYAEYEKVYKFLLMLETSVYVENQE